MHEGERGSSTLPLTVGALVVVMIGVGIAVPLALRGSSGGETPTAAGATSGHVLQGGAPAAGDDASVRSALRNAATAEEQYATDTDGYTADLTQLMGTGLRLDTLTAVRVVSATASSYCLTARTSAGVALFYDNTRGGLLPVGQACS